ncbi:ATP-binding cassette domain-containing protein [Cryptosporangium phraense]|uniref:ATP-binding cassette domain-containing protein n=1 Tax=Cryptosporangium phraense TaxID=2593070 RepID=A0A545APL5_9ACTN|nr:ATP-binding cassette domain-containing protein [Cryptosporangium phraense]TQS43233.1 ATP-binding cassette domain-containing protein [Cryptosporangium phraense]
MSIAIEAEGLVKRFGTTTALDGVDLSVPAGTILGVLGPNGAGKTTAVRVLATLLTPDAGYARVCGFDVVRSPAAVRSRIALTGQYASVDEDLSGTENLVMLARLLGFPRRDAKAAARDLLSRFALTDVAGRSVKTYSGGMRRRLDLAASLVGDPDVLYLDEPTTGLDPRSRGEVWDTIRGLVADGVTVLLTTQYLDEADQLADSIAVIDRGQLIATGTPDELKAQVGDQTIEVRPVDPGRLEEVAAIVASVTRVEPARDLARSLVTAPVVEPAMLADVVRRLDDAGIVPGELGLRRASLDEVFLTLTGHPAEEAA